MALVSSRTISSLRLSRSLFSVRGVWRIRNAEYPFEYDDAQRPNIHRGLVAGTKIRKHFGRRVFQRAAKSLQQSGVGYDLGNAKIGDDDLEEWAHLYQEILGFKIAVGHLPRMEVTEAVKYLSPRLTYLFSLTILASTMLPRGQ